jgi:hypothetical protein
VWTIASAVAVEVLLGCSAVGLLLHWRRVLLAAQGLRGLKGAAAAFVLAAAAIGWPLLLVALPDDLHAQLWAGSAPRWSLMTRAHADRFVSVSRNTSSCNRHLCLSTAGLCGCTLQRTCFTAPVSSTMICPSGCTHLKPGAGAMYRCTSPPRSETCTVPRYAARGTPSC